MPKPSCWKETGGRGKLEAARGSAGLRRGHSPGGWWSCGNSAPHGEASARPRGGATPRGRWGPPAPNSATRRRQEVPAGIRASDLPSRSGWGPRSLQAFPARPWTEARSRSAKRDVIGHFFCQLWRVAPLLRLPSWAVQASQVKVSTCLGYLRITSALALSLGGVSGRGDDPPRALRTADRLDRASPPASPTRPRCFGQRDLFPHARPLPPSAAGAPGPSRRRRGFCPPRSERLQPFVGRPRSPLFGGHQNDGRSSRVSGLSPSSRRCPPVQGCCCHFTEGNGSGKERT